MAGLILDDSLEQPWEGPCAPYTALAISKPHFAFFEKGKFWLHPWGEEGVVKIELLGPSAPLGAKMLP